MDTTFHIRVYDPNLVPAVKVYSDPECTQEIKTGIVGGTEKLPNTKNTNLNMVSLSILRTIHTDCLTNGLSNVRILA